MKVSLLAHTPDPELLIAAAARLCYSSRPISAIMSSLDREEVIRLIRMLRRAGHLSPFEHVSFTYGIEGMSRAALAQLTRHRLASYSVQSQRYIRVAADGWVIPPAVARNERARREFHRMAQLSASTYKRLLELGINREDARFCLLQAAPTSLIVTMNARELLWVAKLRMCHTAQWEVRRVVTHMVRLARGVAPIVFERAGPPCRDAGQCSLLHDSCGLVKRLARFRKLKAGVSEAERPNRGDQSCDRGAEGGSPVRQDSNQRAIGEGESRRN